MQFPSHRFYEDVLALFCAGIFVSLGVVFFNTHGLLTGGIAGIAMIGTHLTDLSFGVIFFLVNIPFYYLAWTKLSKRFTVNTFISVTMISVMTDYMHEVVTISNIEPAFAAIVGGMMIGMGLLIMFRHKSSLGGLGILALYIQNRFNIRAGNFGLMMDSIILLSSLFLFGPYIIMLSVMGAMTFNILIAVNHKPGRYTATKPVKKTKAPQPEQVQQSLFEDDALTRG